MLLTAQLQDNYGNPESPIFTDRPTLAKWVELHSDRDYLIEMLKQQDIKVVERQILAWDDLFKD